MKCKITKLPIQPFMSFGRMPIANGFLNKNEFNKEFFFDMEIGFSENCSLFQYQFLIDILLIYRTKLIKF